MMAEVVHDFAGTESYYNIAKCLTQSKSSSSNQAPEVIKKISYSSQLSMKFFLLINVKMPTFVCWHFNIYQQEK